jgi:hypothetical protein
MEIGAGIHQKKRKEDDNGVGIRIVGRMRGTK